MKRVDLYVETSIKGPRQRDGTAGYVIQYICRNGQPATCTDFWRIEKMSAHESILAAAVRGMKRIKAGCEIAIHTDDAWVASAVNSWMKDWERRGWVTGTGGEVKHKEMFEKIAGRRKTDLVTVENGLGEEYAEYLRYNIQKKEEERSRETA